MYPKNIFFYIFYITTNALAEHTHPPHRSLKMLYLQGQTRALAKFNCIASRGPARASAESTERDQLDGVRNARDIDWLARHHRPLWTGADALLTVGHTFTLRWVSVCTFTPISASTSHHVCEGAALRAIFLLLARVSVWYAQLNVK